LSAQVFYLTGAGVNTSFLFDWCSCQHKFLSLLAGRIVSLVDERENIMVIAQNHYKL